MRRAFVLLSLPLALTLAAGCGGGGKGNATPTSTMKMMTPTIAATATPVRTSTPPPDLSAHDWHQQSEIRTFTSSSGGQLDQANIIYADLTGDGIDDAVVPIASGGESGDIALFVFGYVDGALQLLLQEIPQTSIRAKVIQESRPQPGLPSEALLTMEPIFAPGDPLCCSSEVRTTTYRWDGSALVVGEQNTGPATP